MAHFPEYKTQALDELVPYARNARTHSEQQVGEIAASIKEFGFLNPVIIDGENTIIAGHGRVLAAQKLGMGTVPVIEASHLTDAQRRAYVIADNKLALNAGWDNELLKVELEELGHEGFDIELTGFSSDEVAGMALDQDVDGDGEPEGGEDVSDYEEGVKGNMEAVFGQPPFSVLDTRKGSWLDRKRAWHDLIADRAESRDGSLASGAGNIMAAANNGASILDPVMAELMVRWFGPEGGTAFDPFAGDSIFGYVAAHCGVTFRGIELRKDQAQINQQRVDDAGLDAIYYNDTSARMDDYIEDNSADLIFSCPPYADLEVYSNDSEDLSTMKHDDFFQVYKQILQNTFSKLKQNRFAVIVMGEVRGKDENKSYIGTIPKTIEIMEEAGYQYYNEIVLINSAGTLPLRAGRYMRHTRKVGKMHQNIMVFVKGSASEAAKELGEITLPLDFEDGGEVDE